MHPAPQLSLSPKGLETQTRPNLPPHRFWDIKRNLENKTEGQQEPTQGLQGWKVLLSNTETQPHFRVSKRQQN